MSQIKIKKGKNVPDPEKIRKHKNFGRLLTAYDKATKPLYKRLLYRDKWGFLAILLIILAAVLVFEYLDDKGEEPKSPVPLEDSIKKL